MTSIICNLLLALCGCVLKANAKTQHAGAEAVSDVLRSLCVRGCVDEKTRDVNAINYVLIRVAPPLSQRRGIG